MIDWNTVKEGEIIYSFNLSRFAGRIWELKHSWIKIIKINNKTIKIDRIDDNQSRGNSWAAKKEKLEEDKEFYAKTQEELITKNIPNLKGYSETAKESLEGYTTKHPHYLYYVYSANILSDFYNLLLNGFTEEKYLEIKKKYAKEENQYLKELIGGEKDENNV